MGYPMGEKSREIISMGKSTCCDSEISDFRKIFIINQSEVSIRTFMNFQVSDCSNFFWPTGVWEC